MIQTHAAKSLVAVTGATGDVAAALDAAAEVVAQFSVTCTGSNKAGDYITIVEKGAGDDQFGSYENTAKGSPVTLTAPTVAGDAELRYIAGQGKAVLARRVIRIVLPEVSLTAPAEAIAGSLLTVTWIGPNNSGDYITVVETQNLMASTATTPTPHQARRSTCSCRSWKAKPNSVT